MQRSVFDRVYTGILGKVIVTRRVDGLNKGGLYPLQITTAALRMLAYGVAADSLDE